jgi:predicted nucleic acid-binding protein
MKVAIDTNLLAYVEGVNADRRQTAAIAVLDELRRRGAASIPVQALGELYNVLVRKAGWTRDDARRAVHAWYEAFPLLQTTAMAMLTAIEVATDHVLPIWDGVMIAVAAESGCRLLLSEDLQDGFSWGGVTVVNPFAEPRHPLLQALLTPDT